MKLPYMPMYWTDFFTATDLKLSGEEAAYYAILLGRAWINGGRLPDDDRMLARILKVTPYKWAALKGPIMALWTKTEGGWTQPRLEAELQKIHKNFEKNRENGARGGRPRANADSAAISESAGKPSGQKRNENNKSAKAMGSVSVNPTANPTETERLTQTKPNGGVESESESELESSSSTSFTSERAQERADDDDENILFEKVKSAIGSKASASAVLAALPALRELLAEGCDLERDVLAELRVIGQHAKRSIGRLDAEFVANQIRARRDARLKLPATGSAGAAVAAKVFVEVETPQWEAWDAYRKSKGLRSSPINQDGKGWYFESEWPPGFPPPRREGAMHGEAVL